MNRYLIVHYGEIGLKKSNRNYFLEKLKKRLKLRLEQRLKDNIRIYHTVGRFLVNLPADFDKEKVIDTVSQVFGVKNFKICFEGPLALNDLSECIYQKLPHFDPGLKPGTFRVSVKRSMPLPYKSFEAEREIGAFLLKKGLDMKGKMVNPEFIVDIEFFNRKAFFSFEKYQGPGGLPPNSHGKLISLLSSGIDSPVASYLMMKRGARVIFAHFHGYPYTDKSEQEQVLELSEILSQFQADSKLYQIPFGDIQKEIAGKNEIPARMRTIIYRRMMIRIASLIAKKEQAKGLITGDNFGQVASQTPENLFTIHEASDIPLYQPLIGFDKEEIIKMAENIGTFPVSKLPCKDSCTLFAPKNPEIKSNIVDTREYESFLAIDDLIKTAIKNAKVFML